MPRVIEKIDRVVEYIPDVEENRLEDDPMVVEIEPMSTAEVKAYQRKHGPRLQGKNSYSRAQKIMEQTLRDRVHSVKGYVFQGVTIRTGADLAADGEQLVQADVFKAIVECSHLLEGLKKKSAEPSDSDSQTTQPGNGTAKNAGGDLEPTNEKEASPSVGSEIAEPTTTPTWAGDSTPA